MQAVRPLDMRFNPPAFDAAQIAEKVAEEYGLTGEWLSLDGERDQNLKLDTADGRKFVVKIAGPDEDPEVADFQVQALLYLEKNNPHIPVPRVIHSKTGHSLSAIASTNGSKHVLRIITWLEGIPFAEGGFPDAQNLQKIGAFQAKLVNALAGFEHEAARHFMPWNLSNGIAVSRSLWAQAATDVRNLAAPLLSRLRHEVLPELNAGPSQIIHNDAHADNLLRPDAQSQDVAGLIDFGDMVHAPIINDLAVTATSFHRPGKQDLVTVENLLIGFHRVHPLTDTQVSLLWDAMTLRVLITILLSDIKLNIYKSRDPDVIKEKREATTMLELISVLDRNRVVAGLRAACGM